ncbi:MAG TPA: DegQ family serine endoprotease [Azospirillum sp.]|nr:DegQ family serine endoprotease [Azospirillum sp.]
MPDAIKPAVGAARQRTGAAFAVCACLLVVPVPAAAQGAAGPGVGTQSAQESRAAPPTFADLAAAKLPAVVAITASAGSRTPQRAAGDPGEGREGDPFSVLPDSPLRDFLEDLLRRQVPGDSMPEPRRRPARALGSGFIIDPSGVIVTNNHVVEKADKVEVTLPDKSTLEAKILGTDPKTDLAVLKIAAERPLPAVHWGDSDAMKVGDWVLAIGNPFGLGGTVTAGIVSARARDIGAGPYDDFIQTDAAINQGNSGGPMFNLKGEVIGVNTAIFSQSGGNVGIGFAIPSALAGPIVAELRETGRVTRGWLGVAIQPIGPDIADALGLDERKGALVANVVKQGPAAKAGIETGDIITEYAGKPVESPHDLTRMVARTKPGDTARITVRRDGNTVPLEVRIAELQPPAQQAKAHQQQPADGQLGLTLAPMTPELRREFGLDDTAKGAVVVEVAPDSPAAKSGFRPGDVISRAGNQPVDDPSDVAAAVDQARKAKKDSVLLLRQREDSALFVPLPMG